MLVSTIPHSTHTVEEKGPQSQKGRNDSYMQMLPDCSKPWQLSWKSGQDEAMNQPSTAVGPRQPIGLYKSNKELEKEVKKSHFAYSSILENQIAAYQEGDRQANLCWRKVKTKTSRKMPWVPQDLPKWRRASASIVKTQAAVYKQNLKDWSSGPHGKDLEQPKQF